MKSTRFSLRISRHTLARAALLSVAGFSGFSTHAAAPATNALPTGEHVTAGSAGFARSGNNLTVTQRTDKAVINWQSFDIGSDAAVRFNQPSSSSVALNRVVGSDASAIFGKLDANGKVFLVNPHGVLFGKGSQINVGGLVASSLDIADADFLAGRYRFAAGSGADAASVINDGTLTTGDHGAVALLGGRVENNGVIVARLGSVALAAGNAVSLDFAGDGLISLQVDAGAVNALAANHGLIRADGGAVLLTAKSANALIRTVVNNDGVIEARTLENRGGKIVLLGDMENGETRVAGTLDASAPEGGNGGFIETSAHQVTLAPEAKITSLAASGKTGTWLLDPYNITIGAGSAAGINGTATSDTLIGADWLNTQLGTTSVILATGGTGSSGASVGDITVNAAITWSANTTLTLSAFHDIVVNAAITSTGTSAGLVLNANNNVTDGLTYTAGSSGGVFKTAMGTPITLSGTSATLTIAGNAYTLIHDVNQLQAMSTGLTGRYALGNDIDASAIPNFAPVGNGSTNFNGTFDGLGHIISKLTIDRPGGEFNGLFGCTGSATISRVGLVDGSVKGAVHTGSLVGQASSANISQCYSTMAVTGTGDFTGGLLGQLSHGATISQSYATGAVVSGGNNTGGLVGYAYLNATISQSYATGTVTGGTYQTGGLLGAASNNILISRSYATGTVSGVDYKGGLVGAATDSSINESYATGAVTGSGTKGGLIGYAGTSTFTNNFWDTETTGLSTATGSGDLSGTGLTTANARTSGVYTGWDFTNVWYQTADLRPMLRSEYSTTLTNAHQLQLMAMNLGAAYTLARDIDASASAGANASGIWSTAGFVPVGDTAAQFTGTFDGLGHTISKLTINRPSTDYVGLIGYATNATITRVGLLGGSITGSDMVGGLIGYAGSGDISQSYSTGDVTGQVTTGGLIGYTNFSNISDSYATGAVIGALQNTGGLVGFSMGATLDKTYATGDVSGAGDSGGLVGHAESSGTITHSYATGTVTGTVSTGGLVGYATGTIAQCYATGSVTGSSDATGGLIGYAVNGGSLNLRESYASGKVSNTGITTDIGGLIGHVGVGSFTNTGNPNYWDKESTQQNNATGNGVTTGMAGLTTAQARSPGIYANWDFTSDWFHTGDLRPMLRSEYATTITNAHQLQLMAMNLTAAYTLARDIDAAESAGTNASGIWSTAGFVPVGSYTTQFTGTFDGLGHTISGLSVNRPTTDYNGMFGYTSGSTLTRVGFLGGSITGRDYSGGLVGEANNTIISLSYATGNISGANTVGGLVGYAHDNSSILRSYATGVVTVPGTGNTAGGLVGQAYGITTISESYATGNVSGYNNTGGLVGMTWSACDINNSYATGAVSGTVSTGGLVGYAQNITINRTYATGAVSGSSATGGLVGSAGSLTLTNNFWNTETSGWTSGAEAGITGLTTAQMRNSAGFTGWNINTGSVWRQYDGYTNPLLTCFLKSLTVTAATATKVYDGTIFTAVGLVYSDASAPTGGHLAGTATFGTDANVGNKTLTGVYSDQQGYDIAVVGTGTITAKSITLSGAIAANKVYDGLTGATVTGVTYNGLVGTETLGFTATGTFADKNVGNAISVAISSVGLANGTNGGLAGNYTLASDSFTGAANITPRTLTIAGSSAANKTYDGAATTTVTAGTLGNLVAGESLTVTGSGAFADANAATGKSVSASYTLGDSTGLAGNYTLATETLTADIAQRVLTISGSSAANKTYDGDTTAIVTAGTLGNLVSGESLIVTGSGAFANANAGSGKNVSAAYTLGDDLGGLAGNYTLAGETLTADIAQRVLTISDSSAANKTYDGNVTTTVTAGILGNLVSGETLTVTGTGAFADANAGTGKNVSASYTLGDSTGLAGNYTLATENLSADIAQRVLTITGSSAANKTYDGNVTTTVAAGTLGNLVTGESLTVTGSGAFDDANAATGKNVSASYTLGDDIGGLAGNYSLADETLTADIAKRSLTISATDAAKVYGEADSTLAYTLGGLGLVNGESLAGTATRTFGENVGRYAIDASGITASSNYAVTYTGANFDITKRAITIAANDTTKVYGNVDPVLRYTVGGLGLVSGDKLKGSLSRAAGENTGRYGINATGVTASSNYAVTYIGANLDITRRTVIITANDATKSYGNLDPMLGYTVANLGLLNGDWLTGSLSRTAGENVGAYAINQGTLSSSPNYTISYSGANFSITQAPLPPTLPTTSTPTAPIVATEPTNPILTIPPEPIALVSPTAPTAPATNTPTIPSVLTTPVAPMLSVATGITAGPSITIPRDVQVIGDGQRLPEGL
jgi:filamentous hemagglutinin family protein